MIYQKVPVFNLYIFFFLVFLGNGSCQKPVANQQEVNFEIQSKIDGMTIVAPPRPFPSDPMTAITKASIDWVAVVPYAYTRQNNTAVSFGNSTWQWWGEKPDGARTTIKTAKAAGLKVMPWLMDWCH